MYQAKTMYHFGCELIDLKEKEVPGYKWYTIKGTKKNVCLANSAVSKEQFTPVRKYYDNWTELIFHNPVPERRLTTIVVSYSGECALFLDFKFLKNLDKLEDLVKKIPDLLELESNFKRIDKDKDDFTFEKIKMKDRVAGKFRGELEYFLLSKQKNK